MGRTAWLAWALAGVVACVQASVAAASGDQARELDLVGGRSHSCMLRADGAVLCWGGNASGQLGDGTTASRPEPVRVMGLPPAVAIAAGLAFTCAAVTDGHVFCWGNGDHGQLGSSRGRLLLQVSPGRVWSGDPPPRRAAVRPSAVEGIDDATAVTAGYAHACALRGDGTVWCWGAGLGGQLGDPDTVRADRPVLVRGVAGATELVGTPASTCARVDGSWHCWGADRPTRGQQPRD